MDYTRRRWCCVHALGCLAAGAVASAQTFTEQGATVLGGLNVSARSGSFADVDNDGDPDLLIATTSSSSRRLLRNNVVELGRSTFTDISGLLHPVGPNNDSWSAACGDYDGDGDIDVFIGQTNAGGDSGDLLRNDGPAGFNDVSVLTGLDDPGFHQSVAWSDIDRDLDLDLLIAMEGPIEKHELYLHGPPGVFVPVGAAVGFQAPEGVKAYGMAIGDTDGDGDNDVYISTCRADNNIRNNFFENRLVETGSLSFVDIADSNGTQNFTNSYGAEFHDFDDDGDLDLFMVGADAQPTHIFRNDGGNQFVDVATIIGHALLSNPGGDLNGGRAIDYDNDGDLDLFFHDRLAANGQNMARWLYRNDGGWEFVDVTAASGLSATNEGAFDSTWADFDLDGDQDLYAANFLGWPERFFVSSASTNGNHWLYVRLKGTRHNRTAIGARLYATIHAGTPQQRTLRRDANSNAGTFNQSDVPVHFGLGSAGVIDTLVVVWPNGSTLTRHSVPADQYRTFLLPGDLDDDGDIDGSDAAGLPQCLAGPGFAPDPPLPLTGEQCVDVFDVDGDADVDLGDAASFTSAFSGS